MGHPLRGPLCLGRMVGGDHEFESILRMRLARCSLIPLSNIESTSLVMYSIHMSDIRFAWDEAKNRQNIRKHGISFEEAQTVFLDDHAIRFYDPDHSEEEDRFIMLGISFKLRVLVVCHCYKESDSVIRIISARKATRQEGKHYGR